MNIFLRELKSSWKSILIWSGGIFFLLFSGFAKYDGYARAGDEVIDQVLSILPESIMAIFGGPDADLANILTYYSVLFLYVAVVAAIHAGLLGARIVSKEEQDKTSEFLYVKPITRAKVLTAKLSSAFATVISFNVIITTLSIVFSEIYKQSESIIMEILILSIGMFLIQAIFLVVGVFAAAFVTRPKLAAPIVAATILSTFILSILIDISGQLGALSFITPFKYFDAKVISKEGSLDPIYVVASLSIVGVLVLSSYYFHKRRDLEV